MSKLVLFGTGDAAELASAYLAAHTEHEVVAYTQDRSLIGQAVFLGKPMIPWDELPARFPPATVLLLGPLSVRRMNRLRKQRFLEGKALGYGFASFVHPGVECLEVRIGENCMVLGHCVIEPFVRLGDNVIVCSDAHIGHHSIIGDHCFIGPGAGVGGGCVVGESSFLGFKADMVSGVRIGKACFVGSGAVVDKDAPDRSVYINRYTPRSLFQSDRLEG